MSRNLSCPQCQQKDVEAHRFCPSCRFPLSLVANKYRLIESLAEGGFGTVFRAEHIRLEEDKDRVIKVMKPEVMNIHGMETRFFREVRITSSLSQRNEHIVRIYDDFGEEDGLGFYYVMECLDGEPLSHQLTQHQRLPLQRVLHIFAQMCKAVGEAHRADIIHRDLKPDNIMLIHRHQHPDFVKVLDFGIAKPVGDNSQPNLTQGMIGTPAYMSPEQCMGLEIGPETDIYASGIILYELLTGKPPFVAPSGTSSGAQSFMTVLHAHIQREPVPLTQIFDDIPEGVDQVVLKALSKKPEDRYRSMEEFRRALTPFRDPTYNVAAANLWSTNDLDESLPSSRSTPMLPTSSEVIEPAASAKTQTFSGKEPRDLLPSSKPNDSLEISPKPNRTGLFVALTLIFLLVGGGGLYFFKLKAASPPASTTLNEGGDPPVRRAIKLPADTKHHEKPASTFDAGVAPRPTGTPVAEPRRTVPVVQRRRSPSRRRKSRRRRRRRPSARRRRAPIVRRLPVERRIVVRKVALVLPTKPPPRRRDDMPSTAPPGDDMPSNAPPTRRLPAGGSSLDKKLDEFMRAGRALSNAARRRSAINIRKYSLKVHRLGKQKIFRKVPPSKKKLFDDYRVFAAYQLVLPYRRFLLKQVFYAVDPRGLRREFKKVQHYHSRYMVMVKRLLAYPASRYYLCGYYYAGEANNHLRRLFVGAMAGQRDRKFLKQVKSLQTKYYNKARSNFKTGLRKRVKGRQICKSYMKRALKRLRK